MLEPTVRNPKVRDANSSAPVGRNPKAGGFAGSGPFGDQTGGSVPAFSKANAKRPTALTTAPDLFTLLRALQHCWRPALALGILSAAVATAAAWAFVPRPRYKATTLLQVSALAPKFLTEPVSEPKTDFKIYQATQLALIKSRLVLNAAIRRPGVADLPSLRKQGDPADWLEGQVKAELPSNSELLQLSITGEAPDDLAALVNAVAEAYMDEIVTKERSDRLNRFEKMKEFLDHYQNRLASRRDERRKLAESVGSDNRQTLAMKQQLVFEQLSQEKRELFRTQGDLKKGRVQLGVLEAAANVEEPIAPDLIDRELAKEPRIARLNEQIGKVSAAISRTRATVRSGSDPVLQHLRKELNLNQQAFDAESERLRPAILRQVREQRRGDREAKLGELRTEMKILADYEHVLQEGADRLTAEAQAFNLKTLDLQAIQDEIEQGEMTAKKIAAEVESLTVERNAPNRVRIIEPAEAPRVEGPRKRLMMIALAGLAAFAGTVLGLCWREFLSRRVGSVNEVVHGLGMTLVGTLPALPKGGGGEGRDRMIESIDAARTMLLRDGRTDPLQVLMITSAVQGEGKTSLSSHLAISLARTGRPTLLLDLDLRRPAVHRLFDLPAAPGVSELLRGEVAAVAAVQTVPGGLDIIAAGRSDADALRALGQDALPDLLADLRRHYDFIVIDTPPALPVADALQISQYVDGVLFSVYRDVSRVPAVHAGYDRLEKLGARMLGAVITNMPADRYGNDKSYSCSL